MYALMPFFKLAQTQGAPDPTTGVDLFASPLGVKFLAVIVLLLAAAIVGLVTMGLLKFNRKSWKSALLSGGSAFGGTFAIGFAIITYLLP